MNRIVRFSMRTPRCRMMCVAAVILGLCVTPSHAQEVQYDSTMLIFHYHGNHEDYYTIGDFISALGDVNADGYDDIAVSSNDPYGTMIFYGSNSPDATPDMFLIGQEATPADFDGDGIDDVVTAAIYNQNMSPFGVLYFYRGYGDSLASQPYDWECPEFCVSDRFM